MPYLDPLMRFPALSKGDDTKGVRAYAGVTQRPATLAEYISQVVIPTVHRWKKEGVPARTGRNKEWLMTATARDALAIALTGMVRDGVITPERALGMARDVMHDNAARLYGFPLLAGAK